MSAVKFWLSILLAAVGAAAFAWHQSGTEQASPPGESISTDALASGPDGGTLRPSRQPGTLMTIKLHTTAASHYMQALDEDAADTDYRERVERLATFDVRYDPWLARAARELAYQGALLNDSPPEAGLGFILRSAGAPELSVGQFILEASGDDVAVVDRVILGALKSPPTGEGQLLIGIGEAATPGEAYERRLVAVIARRNFELLETPRRVEQGQSWLIRGRAQKDFHDAQASVLYPDDRLDSFDLEIEDGYFSFEVPAGEIEGRVSLSIDGVGRGGPGKLLQLVAEVGGALPRRFDLLVPAVEAFADLATAEAYAFQLLNEDRAQLGLPALIGDPELSNIARSHSTEMRDEDYFAHQSPRTGLAGDRLAAAGYRASAHGENLAFNDSLTEAESSLLGSIGHRRNIIDTHMTRVGIGLAERSTGARSGWYLTQLFARKVETLNRARAKERLLTTIDVARGKAGSPTLHLDEELSGLARSGCEEALTTQIEQLPASIAERASVLVDGRVGVSVRVVYDADTLKAEEISLDPQLRRIGLAFLQDEEDSHGRSFVVLIVAE